MENKNISEISVFRQKAEKLVKKDSSKSVSVIIEAEMQKLIHELEVHQIELEMQNEELRTVLIDRKRVEELLIASETRYRRLFESTKDGILILDAETGKITDVNPFLIDILGFSKNQFLDKAIWEVGFFKGIVANHDEFEELKQKEYVRYYDLPLETTDGQKINVEFVSNIYIEDQKKVIQCNIRETINSKKAELDLRKSETHLRPLMQTIPDLIWLKDTNGVYILCNPMFERFFGAKEADIIGKSDHDFVDRELADFFLSYDRKVINTGKSNTNEEWITFADDGHRAFLDTLKTPMYDSDGTLLGVLGIGRDITERKLTWELIRASQKRFQAIFDQAPIAIALIDLQGYPIISNLPLSEMIGYSSVELAKMKFTEFTFSEDIDKDMKEFSDLIAGKIAGYSMEKRYIHKNGNIIWANLFVTTLNDKNGLPKEIIGMVDDITERKYAEIELIKAKEHAEESDRLKSAFLANMSHEVRTPLNSIIGFSELLADPYFEEDQKNEFIQLIIASGNNLLSIINDIMDISKMESGEITFSKSQINAQNFLLNIKEQFAFKADEKNIEIKLTFPGNSDETSVFADADRLSQIFNNLIGNAFKFTSHGKVEIGYQPKGKMAEFFVKDTGIGIPAVYHDIIFERFRQVEDEKTLKYGGNGLGLAITKNLVELMGGKIGMESVPDIGSAFYFTLPIYNGEM